MSDCIIMNCQDNVVTALRKAATGEKLTIIDATKQEVGYVTAIEEIPFGHKISLCEIEKGADIIKYGEVIGKATSKMAQGQYVHIHNVVSIEGSKNVTE